MDAETYLTHAGGYDAETGGVVPSLQPAVTFARGEDHELIGDYLYSRYDSPMFDMVEEVMTHLEGGADAKVFASGLAGAAAIVELVRPGQQLVAPAVMYHGGQDWMRRAAERRGFTLDLFDASDPTALARAVKPGRTSLVWIETPVNPTFDIIDIAAAASVAHEAGAILAVDSTVAPPVTQCPLEHGADLVFHSATKYLNGHSDVLAGVVVTGEDDDRWQEIRDVRRLSGAVPGPFAAWLLIRGLRTLHLRYARQSESAMTIARHLEGHPAISHVMYPGLESHPSHDVARRQMTNGFGGMLSIRVRGGRERAEQAVRDARVWTRATSLGSIESFIEHRATVEGPHSVVPDDLIRLSTGIESVADLIADLTTVLA